MKKTVNQLIFGAGLLAVWEGLALLKLWPPYVFPTPRGVAESLWGGFANHSFWIGIGVSMRRVVIGTAYPWFWGFFWECCSLQAGFWKTLWAAWS